MDARVKPAHDGEAPLLAYALVRLVADRFLRARCKFLSRQKLRQCPYRCSPHQRALVRKQTLGFCGKRRVARIADRDPHIAHKPVAADSFDRRFCEQCAERRIVEPRKPDQIRRTQIFARGELCLPARLRELVPWAYRKAVVATIDAVADRTPELARDRASALDG